MKDIFEELDSNIQKRYYESEVEKPGIVKVNDMLDK
jgi:hypothetical protein